MKMSSWLVGGGGVEIISPDLEYCTYGCS